MRGTKRARRPAKDNLARPGRSAQRAAENRGANRDDGKESNANDASAIHSDANKFGAGKAGLAFDVCLEVYRAAKDLLAQKITIVHPESSSQYIWRPDRRPRLNEFIADFAIAGERALAHRVRARDPGSASRLILFRMFYLGGGDYERVRQTISISPDTWADWSDEIRRRAGRELLKRAIFPPSRYFLD
jgi:hypothetical protein